MRYFVLGCGEKSQGEAIAARIQKENGAEILLTDQNRKNIESSLTKLEKLPT